MRNENLSRKYFYTKYQKYLGHVTKYNKLKLEYMLNIFDSIKDSMGEHWLPRCAYLAATLFFTSQGKRGLFYVPKEENFMFHSRNEIKNKYPQLVQTGSIALFFVRQPENLANYIYAKGYGNKRWEGYKYRGRGYLYIRGKNEYKYYQDLLHEDLINNPELLNDYKVGMSVAILGMIQGRFTGKKLEKYIYASRKGYIAAYRCSTGNPKTREQVAKIAIKFEKCLKIRWK